MAVGQDIIGGQPDIAAGPGRGIGDDAAVDQNDENRIDVDIAAIADIAGDRGGDFAIVDVRWREGDERDWN